MIKRNPTLTLERQLNNMLKNWHKKEFISDKKFFSLRFSDSNFSKTSGLSKMHKDSIPFKIIVSSINTSLYPIATFLQKYHHHFQKYPFYKKSDKK